MILDPLVVALVAFVRREGIWLAAAVMAPDVTANWIGNWTRIRHAWVRNLPWLISLFTVFVLVTALPLLRIMKGWHPVYMTGHRSALPEGMSTHIELFGGQQ